MTQHSICCIMSDVLCLNWQARSFQKSSYQCKSQSRVHLSDSGSAIRVCHPGDRNRTRLLSPARHGRKYRHPNSQQHASATSGGISNFHLSSFCLFRDTPLEIMHSQEVQQTLEHTTRHSSVLHLVVAIERFFFIQ